MAKGQSFRLLTLLNKKWVFQNFLLLPLAVFMLLEGNPFIVPHLKALISGQIFWDGQRWGSTLSLWNALLKISVLLHKMASGYKVLLLNSYQLKLNLPHELALYKSCRNPTYIMLWNTQNKIHLYTCSILNPLFSKFSY